MVFSLIIGEAMALFGDAYAYHRMPRYPDNTTLATSVFVPQASKHALEDIGFEILPFFCPLKSPLNIQTYTLEGLMIFLLIRSIFHSNGRFILQRSWHIMSAVYILRWMTVPLTFLPNPNPHCHYGETHERPFFSTTYPYGAFNVVASKFPPGACGNLIFSGHTAQLCVYAGVGFQFELWGLWHGFFDRRTSKLYLIPVIAVIMGSISVIGCRSHYTVDVVLAWIIALLTIDVCFQRFPQNKIICWAEMVPRMKVKFVTYEGGEGLEGNYDTSSIAEDSSLDETKILPHRGSSNDGQQKGGYEMTVRQKTERV